MITDEGRIYLKRYLGGQEPLIAACIAYGIGDRLEAAADNSLQFETGRVPVRVSSYDFAADRIVFKGELPLDFTGSIHELAIFSREENPAAGEYGSRIITPMDSDSENWENATFGGTNSRMGVDSLTQAPAASTTVTSSIADIVLDLAGYSGVDQFSFAMYVGANVANVTFTFYTDTSNYFTFDLGAPSLNYQIVTAEKSSAVPTGNPDWGNITKIDVSTTATAAGAASIEFDGIMIEDVDTLSPEYVMVARRVMATPYVSTPGTAQEIEFALDVSIT